MSDGSYYVTIGDTAWPSPRGISADSDDVVWSLCWANPLAMESRHLAVSYVQAYRQLVMMPARRREQIVRELRKAWGCKRRPNIASVAE